LVEEAPARPLPGQVLVRIDRRFALQDIAAAFEHYQSQKHFGKVCIEL
jgi:NADPH:quinone reductase-like Zn-dependent oxidoreductase